MVLEQLWPSELGFAREVDLEALWNRLVSRLKLNGEEMPYLNGTFTSLDVLVLVVVSLTTDGLADLLDLVALEVGYKVGVSNENKKELK